MRPIEPGDTAALYPTLSDEAQCRYLSEPAFESEDALANWLFEPGWQGRTWVAVDKASAALAGRFVAVPTDDPSAEEIGYITVKERQGEGIASECMAALITHLFETDGRSRLTAEVDAENTPSIRLLERLGFTRTSLHKGYETTHEGLRDVAFYALKREEWPG